MADKNYKLTFAMSDGTSKSVQFAAPQGPTGATGSRGTGVLKVTTAPSSYTTATGGFTPTYRIALSTVKSQAKVSEVLVGDTVMYSYYHYPVGYVDTSYVYLGARNSIRGSTGAAGTNGTNGADGYTPVKGVDYYTAADHESIVQQVIAALGTPVFGRVTSDKTITLTAPGLPDGTYTFRFEDEDGAITEMGEYPLGEVGPVETMLNLTWSRKTTINSSTGAIEAASADRMSVSSEYALKSGAVYTLKNLSPYQNQYCSIHAYWYSASGFVGRTHLTAGLTDNQAPNGWTYTIEPMSGATKVRFRLNYADGAGEESENFYKFYETI